MWMARLWEALRRWYRSASFLSEIRKGNLERVHELLEEKPSLISVRTTDGWTPLDFAFVYDRVEIVKLLISKGFDVNARNDTGKTALQCAAIRAIAKGNMERVAGLVVAVTELLNSRQPRSQPRPQPQPPPPDPEEEFLSACWRGNLEKVKALAGKDPKLCFASQGPPQHWTGLHMAAHHGYMDIVEFLLAMGAYVDSSPNTGRTPLHCAVKEGHVEIVKLLLDKGANPDVEMTSWKEGSDTPLHIAAQDGHCRIVELLLAAGANVNSRNNIGDTPLHRAVAWGQGEVVAMLVSNGADIKAADRDGMTPLEAATHRGSKSILYAFLPKRAEFDVFAASSCNLTEELDRLLKDDPSLARCKKNTMSHSTPLHLAASWGSKEAAELLIAAGADVSQMAWHTFLGLVPEREQDLGFTPLHLAAFCGHRETVSLLLEKGANINAASSAPTKYTPSESAELVWESSWRFARERKRELGFTPMHLAAFRGHTEAVSLLLEKGGDVSAQSHGGTPLHLAAKGGGTGTAALLVEKGADVNARCSDGRTPLHFAASEGHTAIAALLVEKGADINARDLSGRTPLAAAWPKECADWLRQHGAQK